MLILSKLNSPDGEEVKKLMETGEKSNPSPPRM